MGIQFLVVYEILQIFLFADFLSKLIKRIRELI